jgi:hypothetical protein
MEIVSSAGLIMTFEPELVSSMNYPKLLQTQLVIYLQFLEFGELYVMLQILGGWLLKYLITFYALLIILRELNIKEKRITYSVYIISALNFAASYFAVNNMFIFLKLLNYFEYICLIGYVLIPLAAYSMFYFKRRKKQNNV